MSTNKLHIIGAGGYGKVVLDALLLVSADVYEVHIRDGAESMKGKDFLGCRIEFPAIVDEMRGQYFHLAIGSADARKRLFVTLLDLGGVPISIAHPMASVSRFANIGAGSYLAAHCVVAPAANIGVAVIVNDGAVVDHDCIVGDFSHLAPNVTLGGCTSVGKGVLVGSGANILPGISVGDGAIIGSGAVVTKNVGPNEVWAGIPAKILGVKGG